MLSETSARARIDGDAANPEGLVYKEFNHEKHIIAPFPIPNDWRFYRGLDFGKEHPTVSLVMATDGYTMYVIDEYYQRQRLVDYHVQQMAEQHKRLPLTNSVFLPSIITISDHDAQLRMEYEARGVSSIPAQKERISGVETVQSLFSQDRIKIFSTCQKTIWELGKYHYPGEDGKGRLKPGEKADDPVKEYDDCLDTLRYCCVQEFGFLSQRIYDIISVRKGNML
jgi:phage terminase large subunit